MKKLALALAAILLVGGIVLTAGCGKTEKAPVSDTSSAPETQTVTDFKPGTWVGDSGVNYIFYKDGSGGKTVNVAEGTGLGFEYELDADGNAVFHMGSREDNTPATVVFSDADNVTVTWESGDKTVLRFSGDEGADAE